MASRSMHRKLELPRIAPHWAGKYQKSYVMLERAPKASSGPA